MLVPVLLILLQPKIPAPAAPFFKGDAWTYERKTQFVNKKEGIDLTQVESVAYEILEVREDGIKLQSSTVATATLVDGQSIPAAPGIKPTVREFGLFLNGAYSFSPNFTEVLEDRLTRIWKGLAPVATNDGHSWPPNRWSSDYGRSENSAGPGAFAAGTVKGNGKETEVVFSYREIDGAFPVRASGTATLLRAVPIVKAAKILLQGVRIPGGDALVDTTVTYELKSSKLKTKI